MRRKSLLRRLALCAALIAITAAIFVGCGASVAVYDYTDGGVRYNEYEISVEDSAIELIEQDAAVDKDGNKYTLSGYLYALFTEFGYELTEATDVDGVYTVKYRKAVYGASELDRYGTAVEFTATSTSDPFVRTITSVSPNPFNGLRKSYDSIQKGRSSTILERIKNGLTVFDENRDTTTVFPAIDEAFPSLRSMNYDGLLLKYVRVGSDRMESSGVATPIGNRTVRYEFVRYFDDSETQITFEYKRAVPYGWYVAAILIGAGVFAAVTYAATKKLRRKSIATEENENDDAPDEIIFMPPREQIAGAAEQSDTQEGEDNNA